MSLKLIDKEQLRNTDRHVRNDTYETFRFLLASDRQGVSVTDIVLQPDVEALYGYDQHVEIAYCIEGEAEITDMATGHRHAVGPGTLWIAEMGDRFRFVASEPTRLICVFTPPLAGHETGFAGDQ